MRDPGDDRPVGGLIAAAVLLQGAGLVALGRLAAGPAIQVMAVAGALAVVGFEGWRRRMRLNHRVDMLLVMGALGGLGMLAGWWIDLGLVAPPREASFHVAMGHAPADAPDGGVCCTHPAPAGEGTDAPASGRGADAAGASPAHHDGGFWPMVTTWMTALMLAFAIPAGVLLTRCAQLARTGWRRWLATHLVGNALMVAGMIWIGHWLGPALGRVAASNVVGGHVAMLLGMLVGMEAGMLLGEALLGLAPWREWSWRGDWEATLAAARGGPGR